MAAASFAADVNRNGCCLPPAVDSEEFELVMRSSFAAVFAMEAAVIAAVETAATLAAAVATAETENASADARRLPVLERQTT